MIASRIAVQTRCFGQPFRQALLTAGSLGCDGVQIDARSELPAAELTDTAVRHLRKMLSDLNLRVASATFPTRRGFADPQDLDRRLEATIGAMRLVSRLGGRLLVVGLGELPSEPDATDETLREALAALAPHADRLGVLIAWSAAASSLEPWRQCLELLPEGIAGFDLNPAELIARGIRPREFAQQFGARVLHVYANDALRSAGGSPAVETQLGRGQADFPETLASLEEYGYRGWVTLQRNDPRRAAEELADAVRFLRAI